MKIEKFLPVPLMVAVAAFIFMVLSAQFSLLAWVAFITWGAYFLSGISSKSAIREAISVTLGIILGIVIVLLATNLGTMLGTYTLPLIVAVAAFVIVLLELVPWFDMAPGYFLGAGAFFAAGAQPDIATFSAVWIPAMVGLGLGIVTGYLRGVIFGAEGVNDPLKSKKATT